MQESIKLPEVGIVSGLEISQKANKALETIATHFMGDAEPDPTYPLMMWGQPSAGRMWQRNSANTAWIDRGPLDVEMAGLAPAGHFRAYANSPADMTVKVAAGAVQTGPTRTAVAIQTTAALSAPAANPRYDLLVIDEKTGAIAVVTGAEAATPADPAIPAGKIVKARVRMVVGMSAITDADIDDLRTAHVSETGYSTVASAETPDIWSGGETINYTGTVTCTGFPAAPFPGAKRTLLIASYGAKFTLGANMTMDGFSSGYTYNCYAGMIVEVVALTTTTFRLYVRPYSTNWALPTLYNTTNVEASTSGHGMFSIVGNVCNFGLSLNQNPTSAGAATVLGIGIGEGANSPPASNFSSGSNATGVGFDWVNNAGSAISADTTNKRLTMNSSPSYSVDGGWRITGSMRMV